MTQIGTLPAMMHTMYLGAEQEQVKPGAGEAPKTEVPKTEVPKTEVPNAEKPKVNPDANAEGSEKTEDSGSVWDYFTGWENPFSSESNTANATANATNSSELPGSNSSFFETITNHTANAAQYVQDTVNYEYLQGQGDRVIDAGAEKLAEAKDWIADTTVGRTISGGYESASNNVPSGGSWLPVAVVGATFFASCKLGKAGIANFKEGNYAKAATQLLSSAVCATAGSVVAMQSPIAKNTYAYASSFFTSTEDATPPKNDDAGK